MPANDQMRPLPEPGDFLRTAINIVDALIAVHDSGSTCIGLTPAHIFTDHVTGTIQIRSERPGFNGVEPEYISASPYSAPELSRLSDHRPDLRSDLYSLGAILYELLTGAPPFNSSDPRELIHAHIAKPAIPPHSNNPAIPLQLSDLIMKLIRK